MPEAHRLVPSEKVEQKKPARQSASPEQVPHSSVEAHDDSAPIMNAAKSARTRLGVIGMKERRNTGVGGERKYRENIGM
jgi:hypothetical protein